METVSLDALAKITGGEVKDGKIVASNVTILDESGAPELTPEIPPKPEDAPPAPKPEGENKPDSSLNPESKKDPAPASQPPAKSWEEQFRERTGLDYSDEIVSRLKAPEPKLEFSNDFVSKFNEFAKGFDDPKEAMDVFYNTQLADWENEKDPIVLISENLSMLYPNLTEEQIEARLKAKYRTSEWSEDGEEANEIRKAMEADLLIDAENARKSLIEHKQKWAVTPAQKSQDQIKEAQAEVERQTNAFKETVKSSLKDYSKESFKVQAKDAEGKAIDVAFDFEVKDQKAIENAMTQMVLDPVGYITSKFGANGNVDFNAFRKAAMIIENYDNLIATAVSNAANAGGAAVARDLKNVDLSTPDSNTKPAVKSNLRQVAEKLNPELRTS